MAGRRLCTTALIGLLLSAALMLPACYSGFRGGPIPYNVQNFGPPDAPTMLGDDAQMRIGPSDTLVISVFQVPDLSGEMPVDPTGKIVMPLIGDVPVAGKTPDELALDLKQRLGKTYLQSPDVQVLLKASPRQRVTVTGAVDAPGMYGVAGTTTLLQTIAMAKGVTGGGNPHRVAIFRTIDGKRSAAAFDLTEINDGHKPDPTIFANDIVVVDGSNVRGTIHDILKSLPILGLFTVL